MIRAGAELLVIQGTITSAEHVRADGQALNMKSFIADLDVPVIVGGCTNYQSAIHLMRTGAAGVIVGTGDGATATTDDVLGIAVPMATAIADAAAARRAYLDETGGRYVHVIAAGGIHSSADVAKAIACGADAVMLGEPLTWSQTAPAGGWYWPTSTAHPVVPRGFAAPCGPADVPLGQLLLGPAAGADGRTNLFGALAPRDGEGRLLRSEVVPEGRVVRPDVSLRVVTRPGLALAFAGGTRSRLPLCAGTRHTAPPKAARRTNDGAEVNARSAAARAVIASSGPDVKPPRRVRQVDSRGIGERSVVRPAQIAGQCAGGIRDDDAVLGVDDDDRPAQRPPGAQQMGLESGRPARRRRPRRGTRGRRDDRHGEGEQVAVRAVHVDVGPSMYRPPDSRGTLNQFAVP